ncbi:hypothetical protein CLAIMM_00615, partial [Cladophialophora immunda]
MFSCCQKMRSKHTQTKYGSAQTDELPQPGTRLSSKCRGREWYSHIGMLSTDMEFGVKQGNDENTFCLQMFFGSPLLSQRLNQVEILSHGRRLCHCLDHFHNSACKQNLAPQSQSS